MKKEIKNIGFIGLGLIGGSIAKAIRIFHPEIHLYGHASHRDTLIEAAGEGIIQNDDFLPLTRFCEMDILFLCAPVTRNIHYLKEMAPLIKENRTLVTDVGSVKNGIHAAVEKLGLDSLFIGGHPMAGSEREGYAYSSEGLLENAYYILTRNPNFDDDLFFMFNDFISSLGAITIQATPELHDYATAAISHLPHIIAYTLVNYVRENDTPEGFLGTIAAGGFKDITRIASSSPVMWQNICVENKNEILRQIDLYMEALSNTKKLIDDGEETTLLSYFSDAKEYRDSMRAIKNGLLPRNFDFYLDMPDESGQIAKVATILAEEDVNIKNIGIVHNREFETGVLHIELYDAYSLDFALKLLGEKGYVLYRRR